MFSGTVSYLYVWKPQDTAGHYSKDHRTPKWAIWMSWNNLSKCVDVYL